MEGYQGYTWRGDLGGSTEQQYLRNVYNNVGRTINQFTDFSSPYYTAYANYINKATPGIGAGSFLSMLQAGGGNYAGSMAQAMQLKKGADKERRDAINTGLSGYSANMAQTIPSLFGIQGSVAGQDWQGQTQRDISSEQQGSPWQMLGGLGGMLPFIPGMFSGGGATAAMALPAMSDIRLKENISYTGKQTKDGIPIVDFNFIGNGQKFRGVIAQDVEKIRPDAVTEINGIKHVYYGRL